MTGAIIGSALIGAASSASSAKSASSAASQQAAASQAATDASLQASREQLEFQKQQYADWESIFGPIQENLSSYYQSLSPDTYAAMGLQNLQQSYTTSKQSLDRALAQRGLSTSGAAAQALTDLESQRMLGGASIRQSAAQEVATQKQNFLALGLGQGSTLQQGVAGAYGNIASTNMQAAGNAMALQGTYANQAASAYAGIGQSLGSGLSTYMTYNALNRGVNPYGSGMATNPPGSLFG